MPPASEHGESADENVAERTRAYFEDVELAGRGQVNGASCCCWETARPARPAWRYPAGAKQGPNRDNPGRPMASSSGLGPRRGGPGASAFMGLRRPGDLSHTPSFHGQRRGLRGAVEAGAGRPAAPEGENGYRDEWRPLQYWLDLIHLACPHRRALPSSAPTTPSRPPRWRTVAPAGDGESPRLPVLLRGFALRRGRVGGAGEVAVRRDRPSGSRSWRGRASYWRSPDLVQSWLPKSQPGATTPVPAWHNEVSLDRFGKELGGAIRQALKTDREGAIRCWRRRWRRAGLN